MVLVVEFLLFQREGYPTFHESNNGIQKNLNQGCHSLHFFHLVSDIFFWMERIGRPDRTRMLHTTRPSNDDDWLERRCSGCGFKIQPVRVYFFYFIKKNLTHTKARFFPLVFHNKYRKQNMYMLWFFKKHSRNRVHFMNTHIYMPFRDAIVPYSRNFFWKYFFITFKNWEMENTCQVIWWRICLLCSEPCGAFFGKKMYWFLVSFGKLIILSSRFFHQGCFKNLAARAVATLGFFSS